MNHDERELQTWFEILRQSEEPLAPPFPRMWRAAGEGDRHATIGWWWTRAIAMIATALLLVVAIALLRPVKNEPLPIERLSRWRSPTASLLDVPQDPLMTTVPRVRSDVPPMLETTPR